MSLPYKITQTATAIWLGMQLTAGYIVAPSYSISYLRCWQAKSLAFCLPLLQYAA